jgi:ribonuclease HIII
VAQSTVVVIVPPAERQALRGRLPAGEFEFRSVPHALFSAKGADVVATLYRSGKLVVQGRDPALFLERYVGAAARPAPKTARDDPPPETWVAAGRTVVGSDECGKGDYFGPLVVCAVRLEPQLAEKLAASGVTDSKKLGDERALRLGGALRGLLPFAIRRLDPPEYNRRYRRAGQLNELLADLHAEAIRELTEPGDSVIVDRFASATLLDRRLADLGVELVQRTRAEAHPAVAAASVVAREEFLTALRELSEQHAVELHKGAGPPVDEVALEFVRLHGREALGEVAKLHFKNTSKLDRRLA